MKIEIDQRPSTNNQPDPAFFIRLYPETNEDMTGMEWAIACGFELEKMVRVVTGRFHYAIVFKVPEES